MDQEEREFLSALAEFNAELEKRGKTQEEIMQNDQHGVFVAFKNITLNYNLPEFDQNKKQNNNEYLLVQKQKHQYFLKILQDHRRGRKKELWRLNSRWYAFFNRPMQEEIKDEIRNVSLDIIFDGMYKKAATIGKYFFETRRDEGVSAELKPILEELIALTASIYENAKVLEGLDKERMQHFKEKLPLGYDKGKNTPQE